MHESELIRLARQGDGAAWEALMQAHQEAAFRFATLLLGDPAEAEDAAQEAFIRATAALPRFDESRPLRPWLMKIVVNVVRNRQRSLGRYLEALKRLLAEPVAAEPDRTDVDLLAQAIRELSADDQQIVNLRYFIGLSVEETAQTLDIPSGTVKSRLHRALEKLKKKMMALGF